MTKIQRVPPRVAEDFVRQSERDRSEGGRASPVAVDVARVRERVSKGERAKGERDRVRGGCF
jgi:hypothetical protein